MISKGFEELIKMRKEFIESVKKNRFGLNVILPELYNDSSHFIYEILQNAEDAKDEKVRGAKKVEFELFEDRLDIYHNGADFDYDDIDGVTGIGISKKKDDLTSIGKFGVGFKSVFAVTETPYIFSGEYKIKIEEFAQKNQSSDTIEIPDYIPRNKFVGFVNGAVIAVGDTPSEVAQVAVEKFPDFPLIIKYNGPKQKTMEYCFLSVTEFRC
jgi:hypothetical protein